MKLEKRYNLTANLGQSSTLNMESLTLHFFVTHLAVVYQKLVVIVDIVGLIDEVLDFGKR